MKIITVVGARPQFIKAAAVSHCIAAAPGLTEQIVHTGQHFDANMSDVFFEELGIPEPAHTLEIHSLSHGAMTGRMLESIEKILIEEKPDWVLVYGDTNSTLAGVLAAAKLHIPVAHVEAGLRSFNRHMPEELNRIATDHLSDVLFPPTQIGVDNLRNEGITGEQVVMSGDVMYDCALRFGERARERSTILEIAGVQEKNFILCTAHRPQNSDNKKSLNGLFGALAKIANQIPVVLPLHPRTRSLATKQGIDISAIDGLIQIEPVSYLDMVRLEQSASLILTDSGGVQKEAYFHQVPCVTMRAETEWTELVDTQWNVLCPIENEPHALAQTVFDRIGTKGLSGELYGDGNAAQIIVDHLLAQHEQFEAK